MNVASVCWLLVVVVQAIDARWITGNLCWSMPCLNGGSCFGSAHSYLCVCPINYRGPLCEQRLDICQSNPCGNRGSCIETSLTSFQCQCHFGFIGRTCEKRATGHESNLWSLLPTDHTRILFDVLQNAYDTKAHDSRLANASSAQVDFVGLLTTNETTPMPKQNQSEHVIQADSIRLEKIFVDEPTQSTEMAETSTTESPTTEAGSTEGLNTTEEQTSTSSSPTTESPSGRRRVLRRLCHELSTDHAANASSVASKTVVLPSETPRIDRDAAAALLSWLTKHLRSHKRPTSIGVVRESPIVPLLFINKIKRSPAPLHRVAMKDIVHAVTNDTDSEHLS